MAYNWVHISIRIFPALTGFFARSDEVLLRTWRKRSSVSHHNFKNLVLASLPEDELGRLLPHLSFLELAPAAILIQPGKKIESACFIETGLASVVTTMSNDVSVEAGIVGREGIIGFPILLGSDRMPQRTLMQMPGSGFRLKAEVLCREFERPGKLRQKLQHFLQAHLMQVSQTVACNRLHDVAERLARWLLMCHDRTASGDLLITHQTLADMLGTPRPTVTLAAGILQKAGLMEYSRGRVRILNRKGLEKAACECYRTIRQECRRLEVL